MSKSIDRLRLGAAASAVALADVTAEQLMSNLSDEQKTALAAQLTPKADDKPAGTQPDPAPDAGAKETGKDDKDGKKKDGGDKPAADAADPSHAQFAHGVAAERARMATVFASEHYEGREALANEMLTTSASAEEITRTLAKAEAGTGGGKAMLDAMNEQNPNLGTSGSGDGGTGGGGKAADHGWGKAHGRVAKLYGGRKAK